MDSKKYMAQNSDTTDQNYKYI